MNAREAALVRGLISAHRSLLEAVEASTSTTAQAKASTPAASSTPAPPPLLPLEPLNAEDEADVMLADVATPEEIGTVRDLAETLTKALNGGVMPKYIARWITAVGEVAQ